MLESRPASPVLLRAAVYCRKSTDQSGVPDEARSVGRQLEHARAYAARKGWIVLEDHIYIDDAISGAEFERRPGFVRLMAALRPPAFDALIMSEESRLGREMLQTGYALHQLISSGVRVFYYLDDVERTLGSPTDKILISLQGFADELERERARQRTHDALIRKARAGHVCGGRVFGYRNVEHLGADGSGRSVRRHVTREIVPAEAEIVRLIFDRYAQGWGLRALAKALNADTSPSPRAQQGRPAGWAPSSIREVLQRPIYRGEVVWNRTRKRTSQGTVHQQPRPESDWLSVPAPELQIVDPAVWRDVQQRFEGRRARQQRGRPPGSGAKYLLTGLLRCVCGSGFEAMSYMTDRGRRFVYGCAAHRHRGATVCANHLRMPMEQADRAVAGAVLSQIINPTIIEAAVERALTLIRPNPRHAPDRAMLEAELSTVNAELANLARAIAAGGNLQAILQAMQTRDDRKGEIERALTAATPTTFDSAAARRALRSAARDWRQRLSAAPSAGQRALRALIVDRLVCTPREEGDERSYSFAGVGTIAPILGNVGETWRPHRAPSNVARWNWPDKSLPRATPPTDS